MTNPEIKQEIDALNERIQLAFKASTFKLNRELSSYYTRIAELQGQCRHSFQNGVCQWCGKTEEHK